MTKRKTRKEKTAAHLKQLAIDEKKEKTSDWKIEVFAGLVILIGFATFLHSQPVGEATIISFWSLFKLALLPTTLIMLILWFKTNDEDYLWRDLDTVIFLGLFLCYFFGTCIIYTNYLLAGASYKVEKVRILDKHKVRSSKRGPDVPAATISYLGQEIMLKFKRDEFERMHHAKHLLIDVKTGNLGFGVIKRYDIDDGQENWR